MLQLQLHYLICKTDPSQCSSTMSASLCCHAKLLGLYFSHSPKQSKKKNKPLAQLK